MIQGDPIRIFIGSGEASILERKTLIYSLQKHTNRSLDIYVFNGTHNSIEHNDDDPVLAPLPLRLKYLSGTTEYGLHRYLVPEICEFHGKAIYLDSDIICLSDIGELWDSELTSCDLLALSNALPEVGPQFYRTSVMLMNCAAFRLRATEVLDETSRGLYAVYPDLFHMGPAFLAHHPCRIGALDPTWNCLDWCDNTTKAIHYTNMRAQPWKHPNHPYGALWFKYFREAIAAEFVTAREIELTTERSYCRQDIRQAEY